MNPTPLKVHIYVFWSQWGSIQSFFTKYFWIFYNIHKKNIFCLSLLIRLLWNGRNVQFCPIFGLDFIIWMCSKVFFFVQLCSSHVYVMTWAKEIMKNVKSPIWGFWDKNQPKRLQCRCKSSTSTKPPRLLLNY